MAETSLAAYREGQALARAGQPAAAAERFRAAASQAPGPDPSGLAAWLLLRAAELLSTADAWPEADDAYEAAVERAGGALDGDAVPVLRAWQLSNYSQWDRARACLLRALEASRLRPALAQRARKGGMPPPLWLATVLHSLGYVEWQAQHPEQAEAYLSEAQALKEASAPDSLTLGVTLNIRGQVAADLGDLEKAESSLLKSRDTAARHAPGSILVAQALNNLANMADDRGDLTKARQFYLDALAIYEQRGEGAFCADVLDNLALNALSRGDVVQAERYNGEAMALYAKHEVSPRDRAMVLHNAGTIAAAAGEWSRAEKLFGEALALKEKIAPGAPLLATSLRGLGELAWNREDVALAERYYLQALAVTERSFGPEHYSLSGALQALAAVAERRGEPEKAEAYLRRSLAIAEKAAPQHPQVASSLMALGDLARARGDWDTAERHYRGALAIREKTIPETAEHAETLGALAMVLRHKGEPEPAARLFARGLDVLENQAARLGGPEERRFGFRARHADYAASYIELLLERKQPELAFEVLERSRGRTMLETLEEARLDVRKGVDLELLEQERSLRGLIAAKSDRLVRPPLSPASREQLEKEIEQHLADLRDVKGRIRAASPGYALVQPRSLSAAEVQRELLDDDTLLLEYQIGEERSHLWALARDGLDVHELPGRKTVDEAVERVRELLTAPARTVKGETEALWRARLDGARAAYPEAAARLSQMLLGPVAGRLAGRRLAIVNDGALHSLPFAALPGPRQAGRAGGRPLVLDHEIVHLPSASVLSALRQQAGARGDRTGDVAVLADPVFDADDARAAAGGRPRPATGQAPAAVAENDPAASPAAQRSSERLTRSAADFDDADGVVRLRRLPGTREEAKAILATVPEGRGLIALDHRASRATATSPELRRYRVVHFATHALLNTRHPELSGVVLSLVDESGAPQDGFLGLEDIYNLNLPVDLAVLSGCQTALGKQVRGEGLIGLARGFFSAGAARLVTSLWRVDDLATAEMMGRFYRAMLRDRLPAAAALRRAQVEMMRQKDWTTPYYWAGFQIHGEWN